MVYPKDIIEKIKKEKIEPRPRWEILLKNYAYWTILGLMLLFGAAVLSMTLAGFFDIHPGMRAGITMGKYFWILIATMPLIWILLGIAALFFGIMAFHKTKHGYRYRNLFIAAISVLIVSMLALLAHFTNFSRKIENTFDRSVPRSFQKMMPPKEGRFFRPEDGMIAGRIFQVYDGYFVLINHKNDEWKVIVLKSTELINVPKLKSELRVFVSGKKIEEKVFEAETVRQIGPMMIHRQFD